MYLGYDEHYEKHPDDPRGPVLILGSLIALAALFLWLLNNISYN